MGDTPTPRHQSPGTVRPSRGPLGRVIRVIWIAFCTIAGGVLVGALVGFWLSSLLFAGLAALPGLVAGYFFGRFVSVSEVLFPTSALWD